MTKTFSLPAYQSCSSLALLADTAYLYPANDVRFTILLNGLGIFLEPLPSQFIRSWAAALKRGQTLSASGFSNTATLLRRESNPDSAFYLFAFTRFALAFPTAPILGGATLVASMGVEPILQRFSYYSTLLQPLSRCSLDYVFTMSFDLGGWYIVSTHFQLMLVQLGVILKGLSPNQPAFTQVVS